MLGFLAILFRLISLRFLLLIHGIGRDARATFNHAVLIIVARASRPKHIVQTPGADFPPRLADRNALPFLA